MVIRFDKQTTKNFDKAIELEWLETNGLGGWASSTIVGANTRRYHGLLVAATQPPVGRTVLLSKLDETIVENDERFELGCNQYPGAVHPSGFEFLESFENAGIASGGDRGAQSPPQTDRVDQGLNRSRSRSPFEVQKLLRAVSPSDALITSSK